MENVLLLKQYKLILSSRLLAVCFLPREQLCKTSLVHWMKFYKKVIISFPLHILNFCVRDSATTTSVHNVLLKLQCHVRIIQYCVIHFRLPLEIQKNCIALFRWNITASGRWRLLSKLNCTQYAISELPNKPASLTQCLKHNHLINRKMSLCGFPWKLYFHEKMSAWNNFEKEDIIIVFRKWFCLIGSALLLPHSVDRAWLLLSSL